jgi:hypothetical protein
MPSSPELHQQELDLRLALAPALMATHGMATPVVRKAYARARVLAEQLGRSEYLIPVAYGQWMVHLARSEGLQALSNAGVEHHRRDSAALPTCNNTSTLVLGFIEITPLFLDKAAATAPAA